MLELLRWLATIFWLKCFVSMALLTLVAIFYVLPYVFERLILSIVIVLAIVAVFDILFGNVHYLVWLTSGLSACSYMVLCFIDEYTELGNNLRSLREQQAQYEQMIEQMQYSLSEEELRAIIFEEEDDDDNDSEVIP